MSLGEENHVGRLGRACVSAVWQQFESVCEYMGASKKTVLWFGGTGTGDAGVRGLKAGLGLEGRKGCGVDDGSRDGSRVYIGKFDLSYGHGPYTLILVELELSRKIILFILLDYYELISKRQTISFYYHDSSLTNINENYFLEQHQQHQQRQHQHQQQQQQQQHRASAPLPPSPSSPSPSPSPPPPTRTTTTVRFEILWWLMLRETPVVSLIDDSLRSRFGFVPLESHERLSRIRQHQAIRELASKLASQLVHQGGSSWFAVIGFHVSSLPSGEPKIGGGLTLWGDSSIVKEE
ncbi:hypothetical protein HZH66_012167 [Vespula vulgaris]|uniref:Uncharacterized protein n=1 Tax=Vespula vulgaris TaxID=7454 RepID=A0A834JGI3_VESVU|nr:hypothetical protein HZH66_012167 [Vespula vulgaris]